jgi:hypothetical protein
MSQNNSLWGAGLNNPYPQTPFLDEGNKMPTRAWQQWLLNLKNFRSAPTATKGSGNLPTNPEGFIEITVDGKSFKVPYYNV